MLQNLRRQKSMPKAIKGQLFATSITLPTKILAHKSIKAHFAIFGIILISLTLPAEGGQRLLAGPEVFHVQRMREGGTKQNGWLWGGRLLYDRIKRYKIYWAAEASYAVGPLSGHTGQKKTIHSTMQESSVEGRLGYTFQMKSGCRASFTPFLGMGYFWEFNRFDKKSPLPLHTKITYRYATTGFVATARWNENWLLGLTLKVRYMLDPRCQIENDPDYKKVILKIGKDDVLQYRLEFPLNYTYSCDCRYVISLIPFYEHFTYDKQAGYPFDYLKTKFSNYGTTLALSYNF